jgi:hypothetical protein
MFYPRKITLEAMNHLSRFNLEYSADQTPRSEAICRTSNKPWDLNLTKLNDFDSRNPYLYKPSRLLTKLQITRRFPVSFVYSANAIYSIYFAFYFFYLFRECRYSRNSTVVKKEHITLCCPYIHTYIHTIHSSAMQFSKEYESKIRRFPNV